MKTKHKLTKQILEKKKKHLKNIYMYVCISQVRPSDRLQPHGHCTLRVSAEYLVNKKLLAHLVPRRFPTFLGIISRYVVQKMPIRSNPSIPRNESKGMMISFDCWCPLDWLVKKSSIPRELEPGEVIEFSCWFIPSWIPYLMTPAEPDLERLKLNLVPLLKSACPVISKLHSPPHPPKKKLKIEYFMGFIRHVNGHISRQTSQINTLELPFWTGSIFGPTAWTPNIGHTWLSFNHYHWFLATKNFGGDELSFHACELLVKLADKQCTGSFEQSTAHQHLILQIQAVSTIPLINLQIQIHTVITKPGVRLWRLYHFHTSFKTHHHPKLHQLNPTTQIKLNCLQCGNPSTVLPGYFINCIKMASLYSAPLPNSSIASQPSTIPPPLSDPATEMRSKRDEAMAHVIELCGHPAPAPTPTFQYPTGLPQEPLESFHPFISFCDGMIYFSWPNNQYADSHRPKYHGNTSIPTDPQLCLPIRAQQLSTQPYPVSIQSGTVPDGLISRPSYILVELSYPLIPTDCRSFVRLSSFLDRPTDREKNIGAILATTCIRRAQLSPIAEYKHRSMQGMEKPPINIYENVGGLVSFSRDRLIRCKKTSRLDPRRLKAYLGSYVTHLSCDCPQLYFSRFCFLVSMTLWKEKTVSNGEFLS
ncbi:coiled coil AKL27 [Puccinia sorghi]|uniref:Coiled coil AKL27 n=1 Tax=Puccinia sorghi TaxID=27349 RepID=A0A0L6U546_9BASI|nr:coiled coil AKL27 [Puccinia sorghi]